jgi:hypothetical protein
MMSVEEIEKDLDQKVKARCDDVRDRACVVVNDAVDYSAVTMLMAQLIAARVLQKLGNTIGDLAEATDEDMNLVLVDVAKGASLTARLIMASALKDVERVIEKKKEEQKR